MMEKKKFTGYVISGGPVTVQESKKAGIIKDSEPKKENDVSKPKADEPGTNIQ